MSEPKVVSYLKLRDGGDVSSLNGADFQRLFEKPAGGGLERPPLAGLEIGFLLGPKKAERNPKDPTRKPTREERSQEHLQQPRINAAYAALREAVREQNDFNVQEVLQLVDGSTLLERKDEDGNTVLHLAAAIPANETSTAILSYLQHAKADLESRNVLGETPLTLAVRQALEEPHEPNASQMSTSSVSCLLEGRANPNAADELNEETPLMEAACYGNRSMCQLLLTFRADVWMKTANGGTALDFASSGGHDVLVKLLKAAGASQASQASQAQGEGSNLAAKSPAPFATTMGFNTWSGGLAERWSQPPKAEEEKDQKEKDHFSQSNGSNFKDFNDFKDFKPELIFGLPRFTAPDGYAARPESHFPFERSSRPRPSRPQDQHFRTLGLSAQACPEEVRSAYRKLAKQYHPDKNQGSKEAAEKFRQVRKAYEHLSSSF